MTSPKEITHRQGPYFIRCVLISEQPEQWYWHLFRDEVRINGGLNDCIEDAMWAAGVNYKRDSRDWGDRAGERF